MPPLRTQLANMPAYFVSSLYEKWGKGTNDPSWMEKYRTRVILAASGYTEKQDGLDKEDVWHVIHFARDLGLVPTNRLNRGKGYCKKRTSKQLRATLHHHLDDILKFIHAVDESTHGLAGTHPACDPADAN